MSTLTCSTCNKPMKSERGKVMHEKYCGNEEAKKALGAKISAGLNGKSKKKTAKKKAAKSGPVRSAGKQMKVQHEYRCKPHGKKTTRTENLTPLKAIRRFCEECNGWTDLPESVDTCHVEVCPLFPFRNV